MESKKKTRTKKIPSNIPDKNISIINQIPKDKSIDLFVSPVTHWSVDSIINTLNSHEIGNFISSGRLVDNCLRDTRIGSVLDTRVLGELSLPFEWKFDKDPSSEDIKCLEILQSYWQSIFPNSIASQIIRNFVMMGFSLVNKYWKDKDNLWIPELTAWHPSNCQFNLASRKFIAFTQNQSTMEINENDCRWMVFKLLDNERPWMSGAIRKVAFPFLTKQYAYADWRNNSVIYGNPIRKLTTTMEAAGQIDVFSFVRDLAERIRKGAPVVLPTGFDLNQMEATQHSPEMFKLLIDKCDTDIAISILGQNLTTEVQSGSYSAANIHKDIMLQYIQADISLLNKIVYEQLVKEFYEFNFGDNVQIPRPHWNATPPEDIESLNKAAIDKMSVVKSFLDINPEYKGNIAFETLARELRIPLNDKLMNN